MKRDWYNGKLDSKAADSIIAATAYRNEETVEVQDDGISTCKNRA